MAIIELARMEAKGSHVEHAPQVSAATTDMPFTLMGSAVRVVRCNAHQRRDLPATQAAQFRKSCRQRGLQTGPTPWRRSQGLWWP